MNKTGGYNLLLLGTGAILVSIITTTISLIIYHNSGDIYLDRSRPGFLPDESEQTAEDSNLQEYKFSDFGEINKNTLEEYLQEIQKVTDDINNVSDPYPSNPLSDTSLGIPAEDATEP